MREVVVIDRGIVRDSGRRAGRSIDVLKFIINVVMVCLNCLLSLKSCTMVGYLRVCFLC